jgi:hemoglobin/transferrin/lactoferrin receptor protein
MKGLHLLLGFLWLSFAYGQSEVFVVDENDQPLIGVSIFSRDQTFQTVTDLNGKAPLPSGLSDNSVLYFQYLGYKSRNLKLSELWNNNFKVRLMPGLQLEEVVIVGRSEESRRIVNRIHKVKREEIQLLNQQTPADILAASGQVYVQKSQMGGGSPVLRGFEANKVLLVVDGVRMNNAIYRNGHLQNAITIDGSALDNVSVIFGPGSLKYGSDAIGGVMHFQTRMPRLSFSGKNAFKGMVYSRTATANNERTFHADLEIEGSSFASWTSVTASRYGDLEMGSKRTDDYPDYGKRFFYVERINGSDQVIDNENVNLQVGTGYDQLDIIQKLLYQKNNYQKYILNTQFSTSSNIPRYDALTEISNGQPRWAEWNYGPQKRWLSSLAFIDTRARKYSDHIHVIAAYQNIHETRITRRFKDDILETQDEEVHAFSLTTDLEKSLGSLEMQYGLELNHNIVTSEANGSNINNADITSAILTRYPSGDNNMSSAAFYLAGDYNFSESDKLLAGLRWTTTSLDFNYLRSDEILWPESYYSGISSNNSALTWSLGFRHNKERISIQAMVATAFRSPNIDDMTKIRINGFELTAPNPDLGPERTLNTDFTIGWSPSDNISWSNTFFYTRLSDAIIRSAFTLPDGSSTYIAGPDTLNVVGNINAQKARVFGISSTFTTRLSSHFHVDASYNWTRGRVDSQEDFPLSHIPPSYGRIALYYRDLTFNSSLQVRYNSTKPLSEYGDSVDNPEFATAEGSLSWYTVNFYHQWNIYDGFQIDVGIENILDLHYRTFASGVSAPGRNLILTGRIMF